MNKQLFSGLCAGLLLMAGIATAKASDLAADLKEPGKLVVAVYNDFPPFSDNGKGIDVDLGRALGERLGLATEIMGFKAGEEMSDDLRNSVWKGHYLNGRTADVMMHVPVDKVLQQGNPQVKIFGAYHREVIGIARDQRRVPQILGPAGLEAFTREKIGVEGQTIADAYLLGAFGGRLKDNVVHFKSVTEAAAALKKGEIAAVMAPISELEAALQGHPDTLVVAPFGGKLISVEGWSQGMAVKKDHTQLAAALDTALSAMVADGTVKKIYAKYGVTWHKGEGE